MPQINNPSKPHIVSLLSALMKSLYSPEMSHCLICYVPVSGQWPALLSSSYKLMAPKEVLNMLQRNLLEITSIAQLIS